MQLYKDIKNYDFVIMLRYKALILVAMLLIAVASISISLMLSQYSLLELLVFSLFFVIVVSGLYVLYKAIRGEVWALGFYLVLLLIVFTTNFIQRDINDSTINIQVILKFCILLGAFLIGLLHFIYKRTSLGIEFYLLISYAGLALLSVSYSPVPLYSFISSFALISFIFFGYALADVLSEREILNFLLVALSIPILVALIGYIFVPDAVLLRTDTGTTLRLAGLVGSPNGLARIATLFFLVLIAIYITRYESIKLSWIALAIAALIVLYLTQSRSVVLALIISVIVMLGRNVVVPITILSSIVILGLLIVLGIASETYINEIISNFSRSGRIEELLTLTGRVEIWSSTISLWLERPFFGYGIGANKSIIVFENFWGWKAATAHNTFLQSLFTLGVVGTVIFTAIIIFQIRVYAESSVFHKLFLVFMLIVGVFEAGVLAVSPTLFTFLWVLSIAISSQSLRNKRYHINE